MKICLISNLYEPYARGGAEVVVKRTALALIKQGHQVTLITAKPWAGWSSLTPQRQEKDGMVIYRYYPLNLFFYAHDHQYPLIWRAFWHILDIFNYPSSRSVFCLLEKTKPDLVITHNLMGLGFLIPKVIRQAKIRHLHVLHDIQLAVRSGVLLKGQEQSGRIEGLAARIYQKLCRRLFGSPDVVISPSKFLLDFYSKRGYFPQSRQEVVRNPVDERFLKVTHEDDETVRFLYIGQFAEHKGITDLCEAFQATTAAQARLTLIGDGPQLNKIYPYEYEDKRIQTMPRITNEDLPAVLAQTDVLVLPTKTYENSPTVVCEALAAAVPVLVSDIGGSAELVQSGRDGFVVEAGNAHALQTGIHQCLQLTPAQRREMGESGRKKIAPLTSEAYVQTLLSL